MVDRLKTYYTEILTLPLCFSTAKKKAMAFRQTRLDLLDKKQEKALFLAPLLYRFPQEMDIPNELQTCAKSLLLKVLSTPLVLLQQQGFLEYPETKNFLECFRQYSENDAKRLQQNLFQHLHQLSMLEGTETTVANLQKKVGHMKWEKEYEQFQEEQRHQSLDRLVSTMDRAFWESFRESLSRGESDWLERTIEEVKRLCIEIPHPSLTERGVPYLTDLFSVSCSIHNFNLSWFREVLVYLKECDAVAVEPVYNHAILELQGLEQEGNPIPLVAKGVETVYSLVLPLRAKLYSLLSQPCTKPNDL